MILRTGFLTLFDSTLPPMLLVENVEECSPPRKFIGKKETIIETSIRNRYVADL
jgi:hypothetical protein